MSTQIAGVAVSLGADPAEIQARYETGVMGEFAFLAIGDRLTVHISGSTPEALLALSAAAAELAAWKRQQADTRIEAAA